MEEQGHSHSGFKTVVEKAPGWIQAIFIVFGIVFSLGILYNNVQSIRLQVAPVPENTVKIATMQIRLAQMSDVQEKNRQANLKLADAVNKLAVSTAKLQGELEKQK